MMMLTAGSAAVAAEVTPGNLLVSVNNSSGTNPRLIREFNASGTRIQTLSIVPDSGGTTQAARDLVLGNDRAVYLYNGTFTPSLARFDLTASTWQQTPIAGWSTVNDSLVGGIDQLGGTIYLSDMETFGTGQQPKGIVRFSLATGTFDRIATSIGPNDFDIGPSGILYALDGTASPRNTVFRFDPLTGASLGTVSVPALDYRGIAAAADGSFFLTSFSGIVAHYSATGTLLGSLTVGELLGDIDLDSLGRIAIGTANTGNVIVTDSTLSAFTRFRATDTAGGTTFVSWIPPIPEPSTALFGLALSAVCGSSRWRRR